MFVRILSNIHDSEFDLFLNLLPSDYFCFLLNSSNKNSSLLQTAKGSLKPLLGGPTCLKDDKPNDVASLLYPAAYPFLDKWYLGYAMASGTYGMRKFEQEFLLASVAFHINSSFAGKV